MGETLQCMVGLQGPQSWYHAQSSLGPFCNKFGSNDQTVMWKPATALVMVSERVPHVKPDDIRYIHLLSEIWTKLS